MTKYNQKSLVSYANVIPPELHKPTNLRLKSTLRSVAVTAVVLPGLFATVALPAYSAVAAPSRAQHVTAVRAHRIRVDSQSYRAPAVITLAVATDGAAESATAPVTGVALDIQREAFSATSVATLRHKRALQLASLRTTVAARPSGPSIASVLANPPYPHFSLARVVSIAEKYQGVPYVFGGESPAGFDCSGLVAYVYAQVGIALPHSAAEQGAIGKRISNSSAKPGDVVVMSGGSHVGIYLGGGRMIDAPEPGRVVTERAIYTSDYYIVRFGI